MNRNDLPVTADLFYATRDGDRFTEAALQWWGTSNYVHAASITLGAANTELGTLDNQALALAEAMFDFTNHPQYAPWANQPNVRMRNPDADAKRSMCVGDVVQFIFPHADACITVGCCSMGFTIIGRN